jgi:hypothetical protein
MRSLEEDTRVKRTTLVLGMCKLMRLCICGTKILLVGISTAKLYMVN